MSLVKERIGDYVSIDGDRFRVSLGPKKVEAVATKELLGGIAEHYAVRRIDANGNKIEEGRGMAYLDWHGERVAYLYEKTIVKDDDGNDVERFVEIGVFNGDGESKEAAEAAAEAAAFEAAESRAQEA